MPSTGRATAPCTIPAWVRGADALAVALVALSAAVFLSGGGRVTFAGLVVSFKSGWRPLAWGAAVLAVRHLVFRRPSVFERALAATASLGPFLFRRSGRLRRRIPVRACCVFLRESTCAPVAELRTIGPGLRECFAVAARSRAVILAAVLLVVLRTTVFTWWEQAAFNSDHAIVGLMAGHLAEGRAFPLFFYGQSYMLGVEAWLAAPIFLLAGPSVPALQLPLVAINAIVAVLLIVLLRRELRLNSLTAFAASIFFVLAPPATAVRLVEANGGSVEPFLYILLLWMARHRPALFGIILGFGFLHREFTLYALPALLLPGIARLRPHAVARPLLAPARRYARQATLVVLWFAVTLAVVQGLRAYSSPFGPGSHLAATGIARTNVGDLLRRVCWSPLGMTARLRDLWSPHLDVLFGLAPHSLNPLGIVSRTSGQGWPGLPTAMAAALLVTLARVLVMRRRPRGARVDGRFAGFLLLVGVVSMTAYSTVGCEPMSATLRYDLLGLFAGVGIAAIFFCLEPSAAWRAGAFVVLILWGGVSLVAHGRLLSEYLSSPPPNDARAAAELLVSEGVRCARGRYWIAYRFTFLTGERLVVASDPPVRVAEYQGCAAAGGDAVPRIRDSACEGGAHLAGPFYRCPR